MIHSRMVAMTRSTGPVKKNIPLYHKLEMKRHGIDISDIYETAARDEASPHPITTVEKVQTEMT